MQRAMTAVCDSRPTCGYARWCKDMCAIVLSKRVAPTTPHALTVPQFKRPRLSVLHLSLI